MAGAEAAARAIRRLGIGGSIGIDLPTLPPRERQAARRAALDAVLPQPFERTAVNGFGFLQIVRRRERRSLPELVQWRSGRAPPPAPCCARRSADSAPATLHRRARRDRPASSRIRTGWRRWRGGSAARSPCGRSPASPYRPGHVHVKPPKRGKRCPLCGKPAGAEHRPFCSRGCRDRDLLNWLGDAYRVPGPPADPKTRAKDGLDSER